MARSTVRNTVSGTGSKTIVLPNLAAAPVGCTIVTAEGAYMSYGEADGTNQSNVYSAPTHGSSTTKVAHLENSASTVVFDAAWTSFGTISGQGSVVLNVATNPSTRPIIITAWT